LDFEHLVIQAVASCYADQITSAVRYVCTCTVELGYDVMKGPKYFMLL
jgi:hypothetical protein